MANIPLTATKAVETAEVPAEIERLHYAIDVLDQSIANLIGKLRPITRQIHNPVRAEQPLEEVVQLAHEIRSGRLKIVYLSEDITDLVSHIQL